MTATRRNMGGGSSCGVQDSARTRARQFWTSGHPLPQNDGSDGGILIGALRSRIFHDFFGRESLRLCLREQALRNRFCELRSARKEPQEPPIRGSNHGVAIVIVERDDPVVAACIHWRDA